MDQITISGQTFDVPIRYPEGYQLNEHEAKALNQLYHDKLRNIWAAKVKKRLANGKSLEDLQAEFLEYAEKYELGVRLNVKRSYDPMMAEAVLIAKGVLRNTEHGLDVKSFNKKARELALRPDIQTLAKKRSQELRKIAAAVL